MPLIARAKGLLKSVPIDALPLFARINPRISSQTTYLSRLNSICLRTTSPRHGAVHEYSSYPSQQLVRSIWGFSERGSTSHRVERTGDEKGWRDENTNQVSDTSTSDAFNREVTKPSEGSISRYETFNRRKVKDQADIQKLLDQKTSHRATKRLAQPSPSVHLEEALSRADDPRLLPRKRPRSTHDLSYRNPRTLEIRNVNGITPVKFDNTVTLQSITSKYICRTVHETQMRKGTELSTLPPEVGVNSPLSAVVLTSEELTLLNKTHYCVEDVQLWANILLEPRIDIAARMVNPKMGNPKLAQQSNIPWFVMSFLLRREVMETEALRLLLDHAWRLLNRRHQDLRNGTVDGSYSVVSTRTVMPVCIRMIRHALNVWPQALPNIGKLMTTHLLDVRAEINTMRGIVTSPSKLSQLAFQCNRVLSQISMPGKRHRALISVYQQRAQFDIIRRMMQHEPPLPISREGHRALTKILLLLKKSPQDRDWALLKSRSWPPFKVSKTRFDDAKDKDYGTSKAGKSLEYMQGYGYELKTWDLMAQVYSGWDVDGSPTVQSREFMPAVPTTRAGEPKTNDLHAASIAASRTVPEAWAAFLKFDGPNVRYQGIFMAMFRKLLAHENHQHKRPMDLEHHDNIVSVPGDGNEVYEPPTSPLEAIYLPSEPPSADALLDRMLERGIPIYGKLFKFLMERAPTFEFGIKVWSNGRILKLDPDATDRLHGLEEWSFEHLSFLRSHEGDYLSQMPSLPPDLLGSFLGFLVSFPPTLEGKLASTTELALFKDHRWQPRQLKAGQMKDDHIFVHAYRLLLYYRPAQPAAWNHFLRALAWLPTLRNVLRIPPENDATIPLLAWALALDILKGMDANSVLIDHLGLEHVTRVAFNAALEARVLGVDCEGTAGLADVTPPPQPSLGRDVLEAKALMQEGSFFLRTRFIRFVGMKSEADIFKKDWQKSKAAIPQHLGIPNPSLLHHYLRALGILGDHEGMLTLVKWMVDAADDIHELAGTTLNGHKRVRRLLVALRVFLECPSHDLVVEERGVYVAPASDEIIMLVRKAVESVKIWHGWPTDEEVEMYRLYFRDET